MFDIFLKYFGTIFAQRPPFYSLTKAVFEGSRDPPAQPGWLFISFITSKHQVILVLLIINWFMGPKKSLSGSEFMLTPRNMIESISEGLYLAKRLVVKSVKGTSNRLNHPNLFQTLRYDTQWWYLMY